MKTIGGSSTFCCLSRGQSEPDPSGFVCKHGLYAAEAGDVIFLAVEQNSITTFCRIVIKVFWEETRLLAPLSGFKNLTLDGRIWPITGLQKDSVAVLQDNQAGKKMTAVYGASAERRRSDASWNLPFYWLHLRDMFNLGLSHRRNKMVSLRVWIVCLVFAADSS